jgi:hypothetical protein
VKRDLQYGGHDTIREEKADLMGLNGHEMNVVRSRFDAVHGRPYARISIANRPHIGFAVFFLRIDMCSFESP